MRLTPLLSFVALLATTVSAVPQPVAAVAHSERAPARVDSVDVTRDLAAGDPSLVSLTPRAVSTLGAGAYAGSSAGGARIKGLQHLLHAYGHYVVLDGLWGPETSGAVKKFQSSRGLSPDGDPGPITLGALASQIARGAYGDMVEAVQVLLQAGLSVDGQFGDLTHNAVVAFQNVHRLEADGIVGRLTWTALFSSGPNNSGNDGPAPEPAPTPEQGSKDPGSIADILNGGKNPNNNQNNNKPKPAPAPPGERCPAGQRAISRNQRTNGAGCRADYGAGLPASGRTAVEAMCSKHSQCYAQCSITKASCDNILRADVDRVCGPIMEAYRKAEKDAADRWNKKRALLPPLPQICSVQQMPEQTSDSHFRQVNDAHCVCA